MPRIIAACRLLFVIGLVAGALSADLIVTIPSNTSDSDGSISGSVDFSLSDCNTACVLNILISGAEANPAAAGQLISGITFDLSDSAVPLTLGNASVSGAISNGSGGPVNVVDSKGNVTTTTTTPSRWKIESAGGGFELTTLTGGAPKYMIIGAGPYTNMNSSITKNHSPSLEGPVDFSIVGIQGLNNLTQLSNIGILMGTGPDATITQLSCTSGCNHVFITTGNEIPPSPEPFSWLLTSSALGAFALIRRLVLS